MTEASFTSLYKNIEAQWFPGAQMIELRKVFANKSQYFTTAQTKQLIALVRDEMNRLELAKSSYKNITDLTNVSQLSDLFSSQAMRDELAAWARINQ
jgi:hypothetical protein